MLRNGLFLVALLCSVSGFAPRKATVERYLKDRDFREKVDRHVAEFPSKAITNGQPNFNCPNMGSEHIPTSVHSLRPGDIKIVAALGDSLTAGNGAGATNILEVLIEYRGQAFSIGGDDDLSTRVTLPNIIKRFNQHLFGQSYKEGPTEEWKIAYLNEGVPADIAADMLGQAKDLVVRLQKYPNLIDFENDWKLITMFVGANDACNYCVAENYFSAANYVRNIRNAVQYIYDRVPRVLFQIVSPLHVELARVIDAAHPICQAAHTIFECQCESGHNFTDQQFSNIVTQYQQVLHDLMMSGDFDKRDDFSLVVQPFFDHTLQPPMTPDGKPDLSLFAPDCFHFRGPLHSAVARILWNTMVTPVGQKPQQFNFTDIYLPLNCPDAACPFIRTTKNSVQCSQFWTAPRV